MGDGRRDGEEEVAVYVCLQWMLSLSIQHAYGNVMKPPSASASPPSCFKLMVWVLVWVWYAYRHLIPM